MKFFVLFFIALVAFLHVYFMILEMLFWNKPKGIKTFGLNQEFAEKSKVLASNQGLYNGFLAAGLIWSLINNDFSSQIAIFFLTCVIIAGVYGALTTKKIKLFYVQSVPAIIALILIILNN